MPLASYAPLGSPRSPATQARQKPEAPFGPLMFPGPDEGKHDHVELCVSHLAVVWATHQGVRMHSDYIFRQIMTCFRPLNDDFFGCTFCLVHPNVGAGVEQAWSKRGASVNRGASVEQAWSKNGASVE